MPNRSFKRIIGGLRHPTKRRLKKLLYLPHSAIALLTTGKANQVPPKWLLFDSADNYATTGEHLALLCREFGGLQPGHRILDIGCGVGRLAKPLTKFLDASGSYDGFDIDEDAIAWCQRNIAPTASNFRFLHCAVENDHYNHARGSSAAHFRFPYEDASFDLVTATSVFTHLRTADATRYLEETARVLKPGGTALHTWYLITGTQATNSSGGNRFRHNVEDHCFTDTPANPCAGIAFSEGFVAELYERTGLKVQDTPIAGQWRSPDGPTFQDLVIGTK